MSSEAASPQFPAPRNEVELVEEFRKDCVLRGMSKDSEKRYSRCVLDFYNFISMRNGSLLTAGKEELKGYLHRLKDQNKCFSTLGNHFSALSCFYDYLAFEGIVAFNPVLPVRKRYLRQYKGSTFDVMGEQSRKLISINQMSMLINSIVDPRDTAIVTLLAKTGIRRRELLNIDIDDIDWTKQSIKLKPHPKRTNLTVFFDDECARILRRWLEIRAKREVKKGCKALFVSVYGNRTDKNVIYTVVTKYAEHVGLHNPKSKKMEDHFSPHCCRHWFTTHLRRAGMNREFIKELRGDKRGETIDIYDHIDKEELRKEYLAHIPQLGI